MLNVMDSTFRAYLRFTREDGMVLRTNNSWLQIYKNGAWNMLATSSFTEESVEGIVTSSNGLITRHLTIRLDAMLKAVQLPAGIAHLHTGLANMD